MGRYHPPARHVIPGLMIVVAAIIVAALLLPGINREPEHAHGSLSPATYRARLQAALNDARRSRSLVPVSRGRSLEAAAQDYATSLARRGVLSHGDWEERLRNHGVTRRWIGEIIQRGAVRPAVAVHKFLDSPAHLAVIANPHYRRDGVGAVRVGHTWYIVVDWGG